MTRDAGSFKRGGPRLRQAVALVICEDARSSLLFHFQYVRAPYQQQGKRSPADCALRHLREQPEMADYAKGSVKGLFDKLLPRLAAACRHAERSMADAEADAEKNPSTPMHQVIASFKRLGKPQPI